MREEVPQRRAHSSIHLSIHPFFHGFICSFVYSIICSFIHSLIHSFIHSLIHSFIHSLIHSYIHSLIQSCNVIHAFSQSVSQSVSDFLIHEIIDPLLLWFTHSLIHCFIGSSIHWFSEFLIQWYTDSLVHLIGGLEHFPYIGNNHPNWLIFFGGVETTNQFIVGSSVHGFIGSFSQSCVDSFMSFHWHLNNALLMRWCTSQFQHFIASAAKELSYYRPDSYSQCFVFETSTPAQPGTIWYIQESTFEVIGIRCSHITPIIILMFLSFFPNIIW